MYVSCLRKWSTCQRHDGRVYWLACKRGGRRCLNGGANARPASLNVPMQQILPYGTAACPRTGGLHGVHERALPLSHSLLMPAASKGPHMRPQCSDTKSEQLPCQMETLIYLFFCDIFFSGWKIFQQGRAAAGVSELRCCNSILEIHLASASAKNLRKLLSRGRIGAPCTVLSTSGCLLEVLFAAAAAADRSTAPGPHPKSCQELPASCCLPGCSRSAAGSLELWPPSQNMLCMQCLCIHRLQAWVEPFEGSSR